MCATWQALRRSIGDLGLPDVGRAVEVAELLDSDGPDSDVDQAAAAAAAPRAAAGGAAAALPAAQAQRTAPAAKGPSRGKQAAGPSGGGLPPTATVTAAAAAGAAAMQRHQSGRSQQGGGGHIRGGSQPLPPALGSQQQGQGQGQAGQAPSGPAYNVDAFLAGVDARLRGEAPPPPSQPAAAGGGAAPTLRVAPADVRLPPLPAGRAFSEEYDVVMLMDAREQVARSRGQGVREALERNLQQARGRWGGAATCAACAWVPRSGSGRGSWGRWADAPAANEPLAKRRLAVCCRCFMAALSDSIRRALRGSRAASACCGNIPAAPLPADAGGRPQCGGPPPSNRRRGVGGAQQVQHLPINPASARRAGPAAVVGFGPSSHGLGTGLLPATLQHPLLLRLQPLLHLPHTATHACFCTRPCASSHTHAVAAGSVDHQPPIPPPHRLAQPTLPCPLLCFLPPDRPPCRRPPCSEYVLDLVLERKSCEDLVASILGKGNRYERQKVRACGWVGVE
jgi:hypothetical protein